MISLRFYSMENPSENHNNETNQKLKPTVPIQSFNYVPLIRIIRMLIWNSSLLNDAIEMDEITNKIWPFITLRIWRYNLEWTHYKWQNSNKKE